MLPDDWQPQEFGSGTECRRIVDSWSRIEFERQVERFRAHHEQHRNKFADWQAAWKTWVLNSVEFNRSSQRREERGPHQARDIVESVLAEHGREMPP